MWRSCLTIPRTASVLLAIMSVWREKSIPSRCLPEIARRSASFSAPLGMRNSARARASISSRSIPVIKVFTSSLPICSEIFFSRRRERIRSSRFRVFCGDLINSMTRRTLSWVSWAAASSNSWKWSPLLKSFWIENMDFLFWPPRGYEFFWPCRMSCASQR